MGGGLSLYLATITPVDACVVCGETEGLCAFDPNEGGVLCREHRRGTALRPESIVLLQLQLPPPADGTQSLPRLDEPQSAHSPPDAPQVPRSQTSFAPVRPA